MSDPTNKQIALDYLAAMYRGDIDEAVANMAEDIDFLVHAPVELLPHLGHRTGREQVKAMLEAIRLRYPEARYTVHTALAQDDEVATCIRVLFRKSDRDRVVQLDLADFFTFRSGKILKIRHFLDSFDLVQQAMEVDLTSLLVRQTLAVDS